VTLVVFFRGSITGRFVISNGEYCLGRGVCSLRAKQSLRFVNQSYNSIYKRMLSFTTGSTFPNWSRDTLEEFPVLTPTPLLIDNFESFSSIILYYCELTLKELILLLNLKDVLMTKMAKEKKI
jgi:type I restriction enzyme S subunit